MIHMLKRTKYIFLLIFVFFIIILFIYSFFYNKKQLDDFKKDIFIKNISWDIPIWREIPYKNWDDLEFYIIIKDEFKNQFLLNIDSLKQNIHVLNININDTNIKNNNILVKKWDSIKIVWKAKNNWVFKISDSDDIKLNIVWKIQDSNSIDKDLDKDLEKKVDIKIENTILNWNITNAVQLFWTWLEQIKNVNIWWINFQPKLIKWRYFLLINQDTFDTWKYFIILHLLNWNIIYLDQKLNFNYINSKVNIVNIIPNIVKNDKDREVVIQWNWLSKIMGVQLNNNFVFKNTSYRIINDKVIIIKIPFWMDKWTYYINIMTIDWIYEAKNKKFTIIN